MATTTYGTTKTDETGRNNQAIYWGVAAALILAIVAFFALQSRTVGTAAPATPAAMESAPVNSNVNGGAANMQTDTNSTITTTSPADDSSVNTNKGVETQKSTDSQNQ